MASPPRPPEYEFVPRIINPVKIKRAVLFAADAGLRAAKGALAESLPWLRTEIWVDPHAAVTSPSEEASVFLFDDIGLAICDARTLHRQNPNSIRALLSFQGFVQCSPPQAARRKYPYTAKADLVFAVSRDEFAPARILPCVVRAAEDLLNVEKYSKARRFIFHIVDDEPRWFSQFLPVLYEIIGQRADVRISRTFEESLEFLFGVKTEARIPEKDYRLRGHGDDVVCLIADIFFPRGNDLQSAAGRDLIRLVSRKYPRIPIIIASKAKEALELKESGFSLPKGDPGSLQKLKDYILSFTGLGDFIVYDTDGQELDRAKDLQGIRRILLEAEKDTKRGRQLREILEAYGKKDKFSTWLYMHSYRELADRLRPRRSRGHELVKLLKDDLLKEMKRAERTPLIIDGQKIADLPDLFKALKILDPEKIQPYSDNDIISSWLDLRGYPELAENLRPFHGSWPKLIHSILQIVENWIPVYEERRRSPRR
jgi:hypothetical protein